jgi:dephospho-CoA kinase
MLRVGLTGDLGSGKSTVARMLAERGAIVLSSDEMGRAMMQPGEHVYAQILQHFGNEVLTVDRLIDRAELAKIVFTEDRIEELNAIVHPAVIEEQARQIEVISRTNPHAIVVVESALIFTTKHAPNGHAWSDRFQRILLVIASEETKVARFISRATNGRKLSAEERAVLEADAHRRLATQTENDKHAAECIVIYNDNGLETLEQQVDAVWQQLVEISGKGSHDPVS